MITGKPKKVVVVKPKKKKETEKES